MKFLFISPRYSGGIGGHAKRVAEKLREYGHDVTLMEIPHIPIKKLKNPSFTAFGILKSFVNREKYDAVHAWNIPSAFVMKYVNSNKKILSVHGMYSEQVETLHSKSIGNLANKAEIKAFKISDKLIIRMSLREFLEITKPHSPETKISCLRRSSSSTKQELSESGFSGSITLNIRRKPSFWYVSQIKAMLSCTKTACFHASTSDSANSPSPFKDSP